MTDRIIANRYRLIAQLGQGGMSTVWKATDLLLETHVAVKLLDPTIAENEKVLTRFFREAKMIAKLRSRHVVRVLDCGLDRQEPFMAMELLEGQTLRAKLNESNVLNARETAVILGDVARAMHIAHEQGIIHRDLKPDNIFIAREDDEAIVKVFDFGIAKRVLKSDSSMSSELTTMGELFGTPSYMSPEQIDSRAGVDHRTDIWAFGVIAFECLTGRVPFNGETLHEQLLAICMRPIPKPSSVGAVPTGFDEWFARATDRDVTQRFATALEARTELLAVCAAQSSAADRPPAESSAGLPPFDRNSKVAQTEAILKDAGLPKPLNESTLIVTGPRSVETSSPVTTTSPIQPRGSSGSAVDSPAKQGKFVLPALATVGLVVIVGICLVIGRGISGNRTQSAAANPVSSQQASPPVMISSPAPVAQAGPGSSDSGVLAGKSPGSQATAELAPEKLITRAEPNIEQQPHSEAIKSATTSASASGVSKLQRTQRTNAGSSTRSAGRHSRIDLGLP